MDELTAEEMWGVDDTNWIDTGTGIQDALTGNYYDYFGLFDADFYKDGFNNDLPSTVNNDILTQKGLAKQAGFEKVDVIAGYVLKYGSAVAGLLTKFGVLDTKNQLDIPQIEKLTAGQLAEILSKSGVQPQKQTLVPDSDKKGFSVLGIDFTSPITYMLIGLGLFLFFTLTDKKEEKKSKKG